jgi:hypothetical protein
LSNTVKKLDLGMSESTMKNEGGSKEEKDVNKISYDNMKENR